jgi:hypothetical protein
MVDITKALRQAKRNERYRRMQSALEAMRVELSKVKPDITRLRALLDEGLDDSFDPMKIPSRRGVRPADAAPGETPLRLTDRADMFRFIVFATDIGKPCGHGKTHNAALADAKRTHPLRDVKARYEMLEFDTESDAGRSVWDEEMSLKRARGYCLPAHGRRTASQARRAKEGRREGAAGLAPAIKG